MHLIPQKLITPTPGPPELHPLRLRARLHRRTGPRDDGHRSVVPRADEGDRRVREELGTKTLETISKATLRRAKRDGISDTHLAAAWNDRAGRARRRKELGVTAVFNRVDTCAAEFESFTPYLYSSYETSAKPTPSDRKKVMILGSGPNRIGQGIEFDYCCCHASFALQESASNRSWSTATPRPSPPITTPATASTSSRSRSKNVLNIFDTEKPDGVIVQFGGQTPLNLALPLEAAGRADHRHRSRNHRSRGRPQALWQAARRTGHSVARKRHRHQRRRGLRRRRAPRLSRCWCGPATCWAGAPW